MEVMSKREGESELRRENVGMLIGVTVSKCGRTGLPRCPNLIGSKSNALPPPGLGIGSDNQIGITLTSTSADNY